MNKYNIGLSTPTKKIEVFEVGEDMGYVLMGWGREKLQSNLCLIHLLNNYNKIEPFNIYSFNTLYDLVGWVEDKEEVTVLPRGVNKLIGWEDIRVNEGYYYIKDKPYFLAKNPYELMKSMVLTP